MVSLAHTLAAVDRNLPTGLVSPAARARLAATASHFPAPLARWIYLECRLDADAERTDLILGLERHGQEILAGSNSAIAVPRAATAGRLWQRLGALCRVQHARRVPELTFLWLEFDLDETGDAASPVPGVFLDLADDVCADRVRATHVVNDCLLRLGRRAPRPLRQTLARCLERVPAGATVPTFGLFPARGSGTLRICIAGIPVHTMPDYLADAGWPGPITELRRALASRACAGSAPHARLLHLDLDPELRPSVAIEFAFDRAPQLRGHLPERAFLDRLVRLGLCSAHKRDALLRWPGCAVTALDHEIWPSLLVRRLHHVKLVLHPGGRLEAKAYLCFHHRYRPPAHRTAARRRHPLAG